MNTKITNSQENRAKEYATLRHAAIDQRRKYTGEPYIAHPAAVVKLVKSIPHDDAMICAAWLHDTVEDAGATLDEIERIFGVDVASLVEMLTDVSKTSDGNRATRKTIDREHTARASARAQTIKLADLIDNSVSIIEHGKGFATIYIKEKALLLDVLRQGDLTLHDRAANIVYRYQSRVENTESPIFNLTAG